MPLRKIFYKGLKSLFPQIAEGQVLYAEDENALYIDNELTRDRINPPADWAETTTTSPSYIANKPDLDTKVSYDEVQTKSDAQKLQARSNIGAAASSDLQLTNQNLSSLQLDFTNAESWKDDGQDGDILSTDSNGDLAWISYAQRFQAIDTYLANLNIRVNTLFLNPENYIWLENVGSDMDIPTLLSSATAGSYVRITGLEMDVESADEIDAFYDILDTMQGINASGGTTGAAQVFGVINLEKMTPLEKTTLSARYANITINNAHFSIYKHFYSYDGTQLVGQMEYVDGVTTDTVPSVPARAATAQYTYTALGWSESANSAVADADATEAITETDKSYYAVYSSAIRSYTIKFARSKADGNDVLQTQTLEYGSTPSYTGTTPTTTHGSATDFTFDGWTPTIGVVQGDMTYYAVFTDNRPLTVRYLINDLDKYTTTGIDTVGSYAFYKRTVLNTVDLTPVESES